MIYSSILVKLDSRLWTRPYFCKKCTIREISSVCLGFFLLASEQRCDMRRRLDENVPERGEKKPKEAPKGVNDEETRTRSSWKKWIKWTLLFLCVLYVATPFIIRLFPGLLQHLVYSHAVLYFVDLSRPSDLGLNHTINMYLTSEQGVTLGVWHTVPEKKWKEAQGKGLDWYEKSLGDGSPVFIYLHGNTNNRAAPHRIGVANVLSSLGYHAVVMDYRGFGDSTGEPTEAGLSTDALYLYHWVRARSKGSLVVIWGHSLGTGVSTNIAVKLQEQGKPVDAVILEGAFSSGKVFITFPHIFTWYYLRFPYIQYLFLDLHKTNKLNFPTDENLKKMRTPLLILHSKDDHLVPYHVAEELYRTAKTAVESEDQVKLALFDGSHGYLHNGLYRDPALPGILREFVQTLKA
ncbi:lysophosphatidylserine lipase ABHD12-like [Hoplias malabaricus]|uniref:lysophosphatidylserine lipase ABHD12-like n=1 Tax=Hoplias malabaricus TaxID=27720 RepID=UPI00346285D1